MKLITIKSMKMNKSARDMKTVLPTIAFVMILCLIFPCIASADIAGPKSPSKGSNNSSIGSRSWSNTDKIYTSDNNYATVSLDKDKISNYLVASDFKFSIPTGVVINGIKVEIERKEGNKHSSGYIRDYSLKILKNNTITGTDHAATSTNWTTSDLTVSYGSDTDLWGQTWTPSDINSSNFGVAISVKCTSDSEDAKIDNIKITVYYSSCTANAPTVSITPSSQTITTNGGSAAYSMTIKNNDSGTGCSNVTYSLSSSDNNTTNFNASTLGSSSVTLASGATSSTITLTVSGKAGQTSGTDTTTVTASASGHTNGSSSVITTLNVPTCTANAPTVTITPSSQTITVNGGSAAYSMTIKNNDTGSGCSSVAYTLTPSDSNAINFNASALGSSSVTLSAGATSSTITLTVNAKAGQSSGANTTTVTASASGHTNGSSSVSTTLNVPTCTANAPTVSITPSSQTITTNGGSAAYSVTIKNNDSGTECSNVTYSLSSSDSNTTNFNASTLGSGSVTLAAGATSSAITLTVSGKAGQTTGTDTTTVTAIASGHTNGSSSVTTTLNVPVSSYLITTCNGCHKTIPVDASGQRGTPPTAVIGSHSVHASSLGLACTACHISNANNLGHRKGTINMQSPINGQGTGSYSKGASFPQVNDLTGAGLGACSSTYCHGSASTTPKWGTNTGKTGTCDLCHGMVGTNPSRDTEGHTAVTDPQVGAHDAHLKAAHNISQKMACNECHTVPANLDSAGHYDTARPAEVPLNGTIANSRGSMPTYSAGNCSNTWCHGAKLFEGDKPPTWNVTLFNGNKINDCSRCHGFPPSQNGVHAGLDVNKTGECAGCHDHVNSANNGFIDPSKHIDGKVDGGSCLGCHSTPRGNRVAVVGQFNANSHHVQGVTLTDEHCYQCHWEANSDGSLNSTYHEGLTISGAAVDLVIYGNGARPSAYTLGITAVEYTAGATGGSSVPIVSSVVNVVDTWRQLSTSGSSASRTASFTAGSGEDRMVIVGIAWEDSHSSGCNPSSITGNYGGQSITTINEANSSNNKEGQWMGYIGETGIEARSNNTITLTFSGCTPDRTPTISAATYEGIDQASVPSSVIASGTSGSSFSWSGLPVVKDGYAMYNLNADGISSFTPPSGYTERYDSATSNFRMTGGDRAITADGTESRTINGNTSSSSWALVAVSVNPVAGSAGGALRPELLKINQHCLGCHSAQNDTTQPFGDGRTPKHYAWDNTSIDARYSQTTTTSWGKYSGTNITPKNTQTKAYPSHGNASANQRGWNTSETWPNTSGTSQVLCFDCHNSHGSTVSGTTTSYASANTNGCILKDTTANQGGYTVTYKPAAGGSTIDKNAYNAGAGLCFDCHLTADGGTTKPWGYQATFGASQAVMGYMDTQYFGAGTFGRQLKYSYKSTANMGGHFGASSAMTANASKEIGGLCTPCHDPHGVSTTLGTNQKYGVPLLKGTWLTSPYVEDATTADNQNYIATAAFYYTGEYEGPSRSQAKRDAQAAAMKAYRIDQNTFGSGDSTVMNSTLYSITETDTQFAGLCLNCHQKQNLTNGTTHTWKSKDRVHESVKGWKTANTTKQHFYTCSKCHAPHNASLPRLMVSNCLDSKHRSRVTNNANPITSGSYKKEKSYGSGRQPGSYSAIVGEDGRTTINKTFTCHENNDSSQQWNVKTPWVSGSSSNPPSPSCSDYNRKDDCEHDSQCRWHDNRCESR